MPCKYIRKTTRCMLSEEKVCVTINMVIKDKKSIRVLKPITYLL